MEGEGGTTLAKHLESRLPVAVFSFQGQVYRRGPVELLKIRDACLHNIPPGQHIFLPYILSHSCLPMVPSCRRIKGWYEEVREAGLTKEQALQLQTSVQSKFQVNTKGEIILLQLDHCPCTLGIGPAISDSPAACSHAHYCLITSESIIAVNYISILIISSLPLVAVRVLKFFSLLCTEGMAGGNWAQEGGCRLGGCKTQETMSHYS